MPDWYIDLLSQLEGFEAKAYWDKDHYSIGYGSDTMPDGSPVKKSSVITKDQAKDLLSARVSALIEQAKTVFPQFDSYPEQSQAAIIDIMYRGGPGAFQKSPQFTKHLQSALADGVVSSEELAMLSKEMGYDNAPAGVKDRKGRRLAMFAGVYDPKDNKWVYSKQSPYTSISTNPATMWGQVLRTWDLDQNFVTRLWDPQRESITDWQNPKRIATHKLSYKTTDDGYDVVYPEVQQQTKTNWLGKTSYTDGLIDYTNPKTAGDAYQQAVQMGDTIHVPTGMGEVFTTTYKQYYPGFKKGGKLNYLQLFNGR